MVISIMNWKGGQGKTTTVFQLAHILSSKGFKVLAIDLDGQGNLSTALNRDQEIGAYLSDYFSHPDEDFPLVHKYSDNLHYIPNERNKAIKATKSLVAGGREGLEALKHLVTILRPKYDVILIDCPPSYDILTENALYASDRILVPTELIAESLEGMVSLVRSVKKFVDNGWSPNLQIAGVFVFRPKERTNYQKDARAFLEKIAEDKLYSTIIRENIRVPESMINKVSVVDYDPKCNGAEDFLALAKELIKKEKLIKKINHGKKT
jgi:chromosome partitioning protein